MKKKLFFAAVALVALASCSSDEIIGDSPSPTPEKASNAINFGFEMQKMTRGSIYGKAAADILGNNFYVTGTKADNNLATPVPTNSPTTALVFDNYLVHYGINTAGTTESNTANWEYVGVTPDGTNYVKLSSIAAQSIKYWDYSTAQYDFLAFSTGTHKAVSSTTPSAGEIGVTASKYGGDLASNGVAYTFSIPDNDAIQQAYITDITTVSKANYGKEVTLKFKNLGSKVRIALYETVPGYSVKDVVFYSVDGTNDFTGSKSATAKLISANTNGIPTNGSIKVYFPHVGTSNAGEQDYNIAAATVDSPESGATYDKFKDFGSLDNLVVKETAEDATTGEGATAYYLGRTLPTATFAGSSAASWYKTVFPVSTSSPLTLRVDYKLVSTDGSGEIINVYGAKAVVPATYTKWLPNYAYTYIFKISDNTNGWTVPEVSTTDPEPAGLFPITFDAVVAEATDATAGQTTITTVAAPTITTYQQNHAYTTNEYSIATGKDVYVQVMDNSATPASLKEDLNGTVTGGTNKSLLYAITGTAPISEATVMDALENQSSVAASGAITGRNGMILTPNDNIDATVNEIKNGVDNNPISITAGQAAMIPLTGANALTAGTYAYVYDYSTAAKTPVTEYQPITVTVGTTVVDGKYYIEESTIGLTTTKTADSGEPGSGEAVDNTYIYFSKTTNGTGTTTYSYVSVAGKTTLPAGLIKVLKSSLTTVTGTDVKAAAGTFYFDTYITNDGKYAVKVIKIVA